MSNKPIFQFGAKGRQVKLVDAADQPKTLSERFGRINNQQQRGKEQRFVGVMEKRVGKQPAPQQKDVFSRLGKVSVQSRLTGVTI